MTRQVHSLARGCLRGLEQPGIHCSAEARHERAEPRRSLRQLLWTSPALPGAIHDVRAAREHGIIDALALADFTCWADKGYRSAGGTARAPY